MRFSPEFLDVIRARIPCSVVVGRKVTLKKQGREWRGLSPFNKEKTPSFYVNDQKGFFHDFSSGRHGDIFGFLVEVEGLPFVDAVERLAQQAGLQVPKQSPDAVRKEAKRLSLMEVVQEAERWFRTQLHAARTDSQGALAYAKGRMAPSSIEVFAIGYAPTDRHGLKEHLGKKGVSNDDMIAAGLLVHGPEIPVPYDRFRDRLMFPVRDLKGRSVAFGGRAMAKDAPAKYLNSPETDLFHKGAMLFNAGPAREATWAGKSEVPLIVMEGYTDVVTAVGAGNAGSVAPMGTAMTPDQLRAAWRMSDEPIICLDGDGAGTKAAFRVAETALPHLLPGRSLRFASMPGGLDPDDVIRKRSPAAFKAAIDGATPLVEILWKKLAAAHGTDTPDARASFEREISTLTGAIPDETVRRQYARDLADRLFTMSRRPDIVRSNGHSHHSASPASHRLVYGTGRSSGISLREAILLAAIVTAPLVAQEQAEALAAANNLSQQTRHAIGSLLDELAGSPEPTYETLASALARAGDGHLLGEAMAACQNAGLASFGPGGDLTAAAAVLRPAKH